MRTSKINRAWFRTFSITLMLAFFSPSAISQPDICEYRPGEWLCRYCHRYHPMKAIICPYNPAVRLQAQKEDFKRELSPLIIALPAKVERGRPSILRWYSSCADRVIIEPSVGEVGDVGEIRVWPEQKTMYSLRVESPWITAGWLPETATVTVDVYSAEPQAKLAVSPRRVWVGDAVTVHWETKNASRVVLDPPGETVDPSGQRTLTGLRLRSVLRLTAEGQDLPPARAEVEVEVVPAPLPPTLPPKIEYERIFVEQATAATVLFPQREPNPKRRTTYTLPVSEFAKLDRFISFLKRFSQIHFSIIGVAFEWTPYGGDRGDDASHRYLMGKRRSLVYDYLIGQGIAPERIRSVDQRDFLRSIPRAQVKGDRRKEQAAQATIFEFAGVEPVLATHLEPPVIHSDESAVLLWNTQYADQVFLAPGSGAVAESGALRLQPAQSSTYSITAMNKFGFSNRQIVTLSVEPNPEPPKPPPNFRQLVQDSLNDVYFQNNSAVLTLHAKKALDQTAEWLLRAENRHITLELRASRDEREPATLGRKRAESCQRYLVQQGGIGTQRIRLSTLSSPLPDDFGQEDHPDAARALRRRVHAEFAGVK